MNPLCCRLLRSSSISSIQYPAVSDPALGARVAAALSGAGLRDVELVTPRRAGLDHGAWLALEALVPSTLEPRCVDYNGVSMLCAPMGAVACFVVLPYLCTREPAHACACVCLRDSACTCEHMSSPVCAYLISAMTARGQKGCHVFL
jgi:hypothetical protein